MAARRSIYEEQGLPGAYRVVNSYTPLAGFEPEPTGTTPPVEPAFPSTGILDNFNRPNEGPPPSSSWMLIPADDVYYPGGYPFNAKVVGNQMAGGELGYLDAYWNESQGPYCENYITLVAAPSLSVPDGSLSIILGLANPVAEFMATHVNGYDVIFYLYNFEGSNYYSIAMRRIDSPYTNTVELSRVDDVLMASTGVGDSFGFRVWQEGAIRCYHKASGGEWTQILTAVDTTYQSPAKLSVKVTSCSDDLIRWDDFGGGTI